MPKQIIFQIKGQLQDVGQVRTGRNKNGDDYAARTIYLDPQNGSRPLAFDYYKDGEYLSWVDENFKFQNGDLVEIDFVIDCIPYETKNGNVIPNTKLRLWKIAYVNKDGRVTAAKPKQHIDASDEEDDVPF